MKIAIHSKEKENTKSLISKITKIIHSRGHVIDQENPEVVLYLGGDGTFLRTVQLYKNRLKDIIFVGVHNGTLGFFYDFTTDELEEAFDAIDAKRNIKSHRLLKADLTLIDNTKETLYAVNEIRIENPFHTLVSDVLIDGKKLETFYGNGLIVCSSLGSTAYNRSLGGALVLDDLETLQITEIAPILNKSYRSLNSSLILSGDKCVQFVGDLSSVVVGYDHLTSNISHPLEVKITLSKKRVNILHSDKHSHIDKIRESFAE